MSARCSMRDTADCLIFNVFARFSCVRFRATRSFGSDRRSNPSLMRCFNRASRSGESCRLTSLHLRAMVTPFRSLLLNLDEVFVVSIVCLRHELLVPPWVTRLIAAENQIRATPRVKGEQDAIRLPLTLRPQL